MARSSGAPGVQAAPEKSWKVSLALLAGIMSACATLNILLEGLGWWFLAVVACGAVLGVAALVRVWIAHRAVPPLVATAVLFGLLTQQFAPETTLFGLIPTWDTWARFGELIRLGQASIHEQSVPADAGLGILFLLCGGVGLIALVCDLAAVTFRARALVGLPLLVVLWIPVMTVVREFDLFWVMVTAASYLYLLRAGSPTPHRRLSLAIGAGALATALVAQVVLPSAEPVTAGGPGTSISTGASPVVNLGNNLRRDVERRALTYSTESGSAQYLKLVSLNEFDGQKWFEGEVPINLDNEPGDFADPPGLSDNIERTNEETWVRIAGLDTVWLPLPYPTRSVTGLGSGWSWDPSSLSLRNGFSVARGEEYRVVSLVLDPTPEQLLAAGSVVPSEVADLAVIHQDNVPAIIGGTAAAVVGDAESNYEKAVALQQYLRVGDFVYSEDAPVEESYDGTGLDVIATFLEVKSGYCVHFASAMALMARTLGIPSRVAVGFLPGEKLDERENGRAVYEATSHDLHAWPELYFDGVGWIPFEPTTGRGTVPDYATAGEAGVPLPGAGGAEPTPPPSDSAAGERPADLDDGAGGGSAAESGSAPSGVFWLVALAIGFLLIAAAPALVRWLERRSRIRAIRRGFAPAAVGWHEVLQSAEDVGVIVPPTVTPREGGRLLASATGTGAAASAIDRIVSLLEREGYARPGGGDALSADDVTAVIARLMGAADWWTRLRAILLPASLWRRASRVIRPVDAA